MSNPGRPSQADGERARAVQLLQVAVAERTRLRDERDTAHKGPENVASLRGADDVVAARERWLKAVDDHDY